MTVAFRVFVEVDFPFKGDFPLIIRKLVMAILTKIILISNIPTFIKYPILAQPDPSDKLAL